MKCICITNTYKCLQLENIGKSGWDFIRAAGIPPLEFPGWNRYNINIKYISDKAWRVHKDGLSEKMSVDMRHERS